jgi:hypothetical protein
MSSPTYDEQLALPSQDELRVINQLELNLSQAASHYRNGMNKVRATVVSSHDGVDHEVRVDYACFTSFSRTKMTIESSSCI